MSDAIVIARVESVRGLPFVRRRWAKAKVAEVLKGPSIEKIEYFVWARDACDVAEAERGEPVLLFLTKVEGLGWVIENSGRGRMPLCRIHGKECVKYFDVIFPAGTPILDPPDRNGSFDSAVELRVVRDIVKTALRDAK